jgi:hypothetical protein
MIPGLNATTLARRARRRQKRLAFPVIFVIIWAVIDFFSFVSSAGRYSSTTTAAYTPERLGGVDRRVFIASLAWNSASILQKEWIPAVLQLIDLLGRDRVYISIVESGSWDETKQVLQGFDRELEQRGVQRRIVLDDATHESLIKAGPPESGRGWLQTPRDRRELRRIPYLAGLRNRALEPLLNQKLAMGSSGNQSTHLLFLNDVLFEPRDILKLLDTNGGEYASACGLDYSKGDRFYDTFAMRDYPTGRDVMSIDFPYFAPSLSRTQLRRGDKSVRVNSCWNGVVAFNAKPFFEKLVFRGIDDSLAEYHLEGSESCLIHIDNPLSPEMGVWVNPEVRVGYSKEAYDAVHKSLQWPDGASLGIVWFRDLVLRLRFRGTFWLRWMQDGRISRRVGRWAGTGGIRGGTVSRKGKEEAGLMCLINEMQVLVENGWKHL